MSRLPLTQFSAWHMWDFNSRCFIKKSRTCAECNKHRPRTCTDLVHVCRFSSWFSWRMKTRTCELYCSYLIRAVCLRRSITVRTRPFLHIVPLLPAHTFGMWLGPHSVAGAVVERRLLCLSGLTEMQDYSSVKRNDHLHSLSDVGTA